MRLYARHSSFSLFAVLRSRALAALLSLVLRVVLNVVLRVLSVVYLLVVVYLFNKFSFLKGR